MISGTWISVLDEAKLPENTMRRVFPKGISIILLRKGSEVFAIRNRCAHMGCTLAGGKLEGYTLSCPCHEWRYDIRTGEFIDAREISVKTYECKFTDGKIHIKLED